MKNPISPQLMRSEEEHKERVYREFEKEISEHRLVVQRCREFAGVGEEQEAFIGMGALSSAITKCETSEAKIRGLYKKPYFAHVAIRDQGQNKETNCFLSDNEYLDTARPIMAEGYRGVLLPFKQDSKIPMSKAMFHCYVSKDGAPFQVQERDGFLRKYTTELICRDEIENRRLLEVEQIYPVPEEMTLDADELLEQKLQDNRDDPAFRNIIATLQRKQFDIISADHRTSFVVQGCAGSGKSQCLLHRLFFLRDQLSQEGWEHVLLLTPTQLFRNYSAELIRRYQLSDIHDCSISELYRALLNEYDSRFKNRQYLYELSEEYLPDAYLQEVYDPATISRIDGEIDRAVAQYVQDGCQALELEVPGRITSEVIETLSQKLDEAIQAFDARETILQKDVEYIARRKGYEQKEKALAGARRNLERSGQDLEKFLQEKERFWTLREKLENTRKERCSWLQQRGQQIAGERKKLDQYAREMDEAFRLELPALYAQQLYLLEDLTSGERARQDAEYAGFLEDSCTAAEQKLKACIGDQTPERMEKKLAKRYEELKSRQQKFSEDVLMLSDEVEAEAQWLKQRAAETEGQHTSNAIHRTQMDRARYFLSRIESTVFEREVWNTLAPMKEKYQIETLKIEAGRDGHQKESRILYKSDLLFYLKIYARLHPEARLPDYRMLCIDEGQDLHKADYDMLHQLYPQAVFNIFGDTEQVLHASCGIHNWTEETNIPTVYILNRNYRNTAGIVDFCNRTLKSSMDYVGRVQTNQIPKVLRQSSELRETLRLPAITVILQNRKMLEKMCEVAGMRMDNFEYLDTHTTSAASKKIPCYSIFAAKGLEFKSVLVYAEGMTKNQRVVACTRAMGRLYYYG